MSPTHHVASARVNEESPVKWVRYCPPAEAFRGENEPGEDDCSMLLLSCVVFITPVLPFCGDSSRQNSQPFGDP